MTERPFQKLWIVCEGGPFKGRPTHATRISPAGSARVPVMVEAEVLSLRQLFVLCRRGQGDMVLAASTSREKLLPVQEKLGKAAGHYEIVPLPLVE